MCTCYYFYLPPAERKGPHLKFKRCSYNLPSSAVDSSVGRGPSWVYILLIVPSSFFFFFLTHLLLSFQWHELGDHRLSLFYGLVFLGCCHPIKSSAHRGLWNFSVTWTWLSVQSREGSSPEDGAKRDPFSISPARKTTRTHCHPSKQSLAFHLFQKYFRYFLTHAGHLVYDFSACLSQLTQTGPGGATIEDLLRGEGELGYWVELNGSCNVYEALRLSSVVFELLRCSRQSYYSSPLLLRFNSWHYI